MEKEGVVNLGRALLENLHPSQMVKSDKMKTNTPTSYYYAIFLYKDDKS